MNLDEYAKLMQKQKKPARYRNKKLTAHGIVFDSQAEWRRYETLLYFAGQNKIEDIQLQYTFPVVVNGHKICVYRADFRYYDRVAKKHVVEDVKSPVTAKDPVYRLKKKLVEAIHNVEIMEIK